MRHGANPYDLADGRGWERAIDLAGRFASEARARRYEWYRKTIRPEPQERLLDLGCGTGWSLAELDHEAYVTGVDLSERAGFDRPNQRFVVADACALPFADKSFDVAYSNSLIEHIAVQRRGDFARELRRVATRYWVQTPNYWFPIEPHALLPGAQFLPGPARRLAWRASPRGIAYEDSLRLLSRQEMGELFDDAIIMAERIGPLTKSLVAVGPRHLFRKVR